MADVSLVFNILGRDRVSDVLRKVKREAATANDENLKGFRALEQQIVKTRAEATKLAEEFARTGEADAKRDWQRADRQAKQLERLRDQLTKSLGGNGSGGDGGGILGNLLGKMPAPSGFTGWLAVGAGAAAPAIGAAVNAGILLGVGGGALTAGIIAAAQDQRVQAAWKETGGFVVQTFRTASAPLIGPLIDTASKFEAAWARMLPSIRGGMAQLGPVIDGIADGVIGFVDKMGPGLSKAFQASLPLLRQVGYELPRLGESMGTFFDLIAEGEPGALAFFHDLMSVVDAGVVAVGGLTFGLSKLYEANRITWKAATGDFRGARDSMAELVYGVEANVHAGELLPGVFAKVTEAAKVGGAAARETSDLARQVGFAAEAAGLGARVAEGDFRILAGAISATATTSDILAGQMTDRLMGTMLGVSHSTLGVKSAQLDLKDTFDANGSAIDRHTGLVSMNTRAGISNREAVLTAVESNLRMYDAQIASGAGADVAAQKYGQNTEALRAQLRQAGLTEQQIGDLIGEYGKVPGKVNTAIAMQGLTDAINGLADLLRQVNGIPTYKRVTIDQVTVARRIDAGGVVPGTGGVRAMAKGGLRAAAVGTYLPPTDPGWILAGEPQTGGEYLIPRQGLSQSRARELGQAAVGGYGLDVVPRIQAGAYASRSAAGMAMPRGGTTVVNVQNNYVINDATDPNRVVSAIRQYEQNNGTAWREKR